MDKLTGVVAALKSRDDVGSKKGVNLLSIVQKLTEKRNAFSSSANVASKKK